MKNLSKYVLSGLVWGCLVQSASAQKVDEGVSVTQKQTVSENPIVGDAKDVSRKPLPVMSTEEINQCENALKEEGVQFQVLEPIAGENGCGVVRPYEILDINGVSVKPATEIRCTTALAFARWVNDSVVPASKTLIGNNAQPVKLQTIQQASTYVCRRRNNQPTGKLSEHATGSGIDVSMLNFDDGSVQSIRPYDKVNTINAAFQKAIRSSACLYFTTVLGPGSDAYHDDHLHLDVADRRLRSRYCR